MSKIKESLVEARDIVHCLKNTQGNNRLERAQFICQIWNLTQMIHIADSIERAQKRLRQKHR